MQYKMIEFLVLIVGIIAILLMISSFFNKVSVPVNIIVIIALLFFILRDLKKHELHKFYLLSLLLTAIMLIFSSTRLFKWLFDILALAYLNLITETLLFIYLIANISRIAYDLIGIITEKYRR